MTKVETPAANASAAEMIDEQQAYSRAMIGAKAEQLATAQHREAVALASLAVAERRLALADKRAADQVAEIAALKAQLELLQKAAPPPSLAPAPDAPA